MGLNLIINETFLIYNLNFWQLENFQHFDFFNLNNTIKHNFVVFETLIFINLGLIGFLVCYFIPNKMFNNIIIKTILLCFFLVQYFWFIHFINVVNFLNLYPFGLKFKILNFNSFLKELNYGLFFNPLNYNFIIVSVVLTFISCILIILENDNSNNKKAIQNVFLINFFSLNLFLSDNLILFFFFLECTIFPMVFLIGFFGPRNEKNKASIFYFYVSLISGFLIFIGISILSYWFNDLNIYNLFKNFVSFDFNYLFNFYNSFECHVAFLCLFVGLAIKLPIFPFHIWLPEAHGEANTVGSILLAGIYLKMSAYGFLFIVVPIFDPILKIYQNFLQIFFFLSIILSSIVLFKIVDLKKFIAYTSIIHMNFTILLIFVKKIEGLFSMIFSLVTHSYVTSALFFLVGLIYKRTHTRNILNFKLISFFENSSKLSLIFFFFFIN